MIALSIIAAVIFTFEFIICLTFAIVYNNAESLRLFLIDNNMHEEIAMLDEICSEPGRTIISKIIPFVSFQALLGMFISYYILF